MYEMTDLESTLISRIAYDEDNELLHIYFKKYYMEFATYKDVPLDYFLQFSQEKSIGKFYLAMIKPNFSLFQTNLMANKPKGINVASDKKRFIKMRINVKKLNPAFFYVSEKNADNVYADMTLQLLPDGTVDAYENLGMITQDVPKEIYEAETKKKLKPEQRTQGEILGNGKELLWGAADEDATPGSNAGSLGLSPDAIDDLPF